MCRLCVAFGFSAVYASCAECGVKNVNVDFSCSTVAPIIDLDKRGHLVVFQMVVNFLFCCLYFDVSDEIRGDVHASGGLEPCR